MFGALNRFIARLDSDSPNNNSSGHGAFGFQVLGNKDSDLAIEPWYDFVVGINGRIIDDPDSNLFAQEVRNCAGTSVTLGLWSAKGSRLRTLQIPVPADPPTLGISLQWTPLSSTEDVWHILDVAPNSPADQAGLLPYADYIIGTPEGIVRGESGLGELVEDHISRPLDLYIHNHEYNVTRLLTITPSRHWGGSGLLGCVLGYGALHRLPPPLNEPPQAPGETLFETARFSNEEDRRPDSSTGYFPPTSIARPGSTGARGTQDFVTPATQFSNLSTPPPALQTQPSHSPSASSPGVAAPPKSQAGHKPARGGTARTRPGAADLGSTMDEYFREGEEKSRELDGGGTSTPKKTGGPPPPPRAAGGGGGGGTAVGKGGSAPVLEEATTEAKDGQDAGGSRGEAGEASTLPAESQEQENAADDGSID
ncbi:MAG: hypothetical protein M1837_003485 [Sclerophora amabilis]|nr:MAG: hypothetical protein M1837_003485 [Sclerophora amabilis]